MLNADMLIAWPNTASTSDPWTLSHRNAPSIGYASSYNTPTLASSSASTNGSTTSFYTFLPELSTSRSTTSYSAVSCIRLLSLSDYPTTTASKPYATLSWAPTGFIYASCNINPGSISEETASLSQHDQVRSLEFLLVFPAAFGSR